MALLQQVPEVKKSFRNQGFDTSNDVKSYPVTFVFFCFFFCFAVDYIVLASVRIGWQNTSDPNPLCLRVLPPHQKYTKGQLQVFIDRLDLWVTRTYRRPKQIFIDLEFTIIVRV